MKERDKGREREKRERARPLKWGMYVLQVLLAVTVNIIIVLLFKWQKLASLIYSPPWDILTSPDFQSPTVNFPYRRFQFLFPGVQTNA